MLDRLYFSHKIEVRKSPIHRWGVFAKFDIFENEILEEIPFVILPINKGESSSLLIDYRFNYPQFESEHQVIPFGFSCLYNHSDTPNATWHTDIKNEIFVFRTIKNIPKDTEICTYYGGENYWNDGRSNTVKK